jgi:hypothetical protein
MLAHDVKREKAEEARIAKIQARLQAHQDDDGEHMARIISKLRAGTEIIINRMPKKKAAFNGVHATVTGFKTGDPNRVEAVLSLPEPITLLNGAEICDGQKIDVLISKMDLVEDEDLVDADIEE